jgi:anti-anti-sigma factor
MIAKGMEAMAAEEVLGWTQTGGQLRRVRLGLGGVRSVVWLSGEHDLTTQRVVTAALACAAAAEVDVVVDLTDVSFMDASILGVMVDSHRLLADRGNRLTFRGAQGVARRVIEVCGLADLIEGPVNALETWVEVPSGKPADSANVLRPNGGVAPTFEVGKPPQDARF